MKLSGNAIYTSKNSGPVFGQGHDIKITPDCNQSKTAQFNVSTTFGLKEPNFFNRKPTTKKKSGLFDDDFYEEDYGNDPFAIPASHISSV